MSESSHIPLDGPEFSGIADGIGEVTENLAKFAAEAVRATDVALRQLNKTRAETAEVKEIRAIEAYKNMDRDPEIRDNILSNLKASILFGEDARIDLSRIHVNQIDELSRKHDNQPPLITRKGALTDHGREVHEAKLERLGAKLPEFDIRQVPEPLQSQVTLWVGEYHQRIQAQEPEQSLTANPTDTAANAQSAETDLQSTLEPETPATSEDIAAATNSETADAAPEADVTAEATRTIPDTLGQATIAHEVSISPADIADIPRDELLRMASERAFGAAAAIDKAIDEIDSMDLRLVSVDVEAAKAATTAAREERTTRLEGLRIALDAEGQVEQHTYSPLRLQAAANQLNQAPDNAKTVVAQRVYPHIAAEPLELESDYDNFLKVGRNLPSTDLEYGQQVVRELTDAGRLSQDIDPAQKHDLAFIAQHSRGDLDNQETRGLVRRVGLDPDEVIGRPELQADQKPSENNSARYERAMPQWKQEFHDRNTPQQPAYEAPAPAPAQVRHKPTSSNSPAPSSGKSRGR